MDRESPVPLWVVISIGVVLLGSIYLLGRPPITAPQGGIAMEQLRPLPQTNVTASAHTPIVSSETNLSKKDNPALYLLATSREIKSPPPNLQDFPEFSYYGLTFRSPWKETPEIKQGKASVHLRFGGNKAIVLSKTVAGGEWVATVLRHPEMQGYESLGKEHFASNYELRRYLYTITPDMLSLAPKQGLTAMNRLFTWKDSVGINDDLLYSVNAPSIRALQYGDPARRESLALELFDKQDNFFTLFIGNNVTQDDIDVILASARNQ